MDDIQASIRDHKAQMNIDRIESKDNPGNVIRPFQTSVQDGSWGKKPGWIVENWLQRGELHMLTGKGGVGKSRLILQLCAEIAKQPSEYKTHWVSAVHPGSSSIDIHGERVEDMHEYNGLRVLSVFLEDGEAKFARRVNKLDNHIDTSAKFEEVYQDRWLLRFDRGCGPIWERNNWTDLGKAILADATGANPKTGGDPVDVLVIDTLGYAYGDSENDRAAVSRFCGHLSAIAEANDMAIVLVAHPSKSSADYSGSTAWHGNVRGLWTMGREEKTTSGTRVFSKNYRLFLDKSSEGIGWKTVWMNSDAGGPFYSCNGMGGWVTESGFTVDGEDAGVDEDEQPTRPAFNKYAKTKGPRP